MSKITDIAADYRRELNRNERYVLRELARRWVRVSLQLQNEIDNLVRAVDVARQQGTPIHGSWLHSLDRYRSMKAQAARMTAAYATESAALVRQMELENATLGIDQALDMLNALEPDHPSWTRVNERGMEFMSGILADGSPLEQLIRDAAAESA